MNANLLKLNDEKTGICNCGNKSTIKQTQGHLC